VHAFVAATPASIVNKSIDQISASIPGAGGLIGQGNAIVNALPIPDIAKTFLKNPIIGQAEAAIALVPAVVSGIADVGKSVVGAITSLFNGPPAFTGTAAQEIAFAASPLASITTTAKEAAVIEAAKPVVYKSPYGGKVDPNL
jgi:hypothetical protein